MAFLKEVSKLYLPGHSQIPDTPGVGSEQKSQNEDPSVNFDCTISPRNCSRTNCVLSKRQRSDKLGKDLQILERCKSEELRVENSCLENVWNTATSRAKSLPSGL